jgi:hypothetical protein
LDECRNSADHRTLVEGLKLVLPARTSSLTRERLGHLHRDAAKWQLYEFDEGHDSLAEVGDRGNIATRLIHCPNESATLGRFADSVHSVLTLLPECDVAVLSAAEIAFRWHGLEFARVSHEPGSFRSGQEIVFGVGAEERTLDERNAAAFSDLVNRLRCARSPQGARHQALWRLHPERWLESLVVRDVSTVDKRLDHGCLYSQVPAFSASDRAMLDVLTITRDNRLAVVELKADEDIHLPLQGLDYWSRVEWHHVRGEFQQFGYFPDTNSQTRIPFYFWWPRPCTFTLLRIPCCITWHRKLIGLWWGSTSAGEMACA